MKHVKERSILILMLLGLPALYWIFGIRPSVQRMNEFRTRIQAANEESKDYPRFASISQDERPLLEDPQAQWRGRIPVIRTDQDRIAHYDEVVSELTEAWRGAGMTPLSMRSSWDSIKASFTVPKGLDEVGGRGAPTLDAPELRVKGWVLEAGIPGNTGNLFRMMAVVESVHPLLEPVGIRWQAGPDERRQYLLFRNLVLSP